MDRMLKETLIAGFSILLLVFTCVAVINKILAPAKVSKVEELRHIVNELGVDARTEDILGKVADTNMNIRQYQVYNKIPIICLTVPNELVNIEPITIPKAKD